MFLLVFLCWFCLSFSLEEEENFDLFSKRWIKLSHMFRGLFNFRNDLSNLLGREGGDDTSFSLTKDNAHLRVGPLEHGPRKEVFTASPVCGGVGRPFQQNVCSSDVCRVSSFRCDGDSNRTTDYSKCTIDRMTCLDPSRSNCLVAEADCFGERVERFEMPSNFSECVVRRVVCEDEFINFIASQSCVQSQLSCNGTAMVFGESVNVSRLDDPCVVQRVPCSSPSQKCQEWLRICDNAENCTWMSKTCVDGCYVEEKKDICDCPVDYLPPQCARKRLFTCYFNLVSPVPNCQYFDNSDAAKKVSDPVCFRYNSKTGRETFRFSLNCTFDQKPVDSFHRDDGFNYSVWNTETRFALSTKFFNSIDWKARLKGFNWNFLSDAGLTQSIPLTAAHFEGREQIAFTLEFGKINSFRFMVGGRLYTEIGFDPSVDIPGMLSERQRVYRLFLDFPDLVDLDSRKTPTQRTAIEQAKSSYAAFIIALVFIIPGVAILISACFVNASNHDENKEKYE